MNKNEFGILVCTSGVGMSITANKIPGVRAALVFDEEMAGMARQHNAAGDIRGAMIVAAGLIEGVTFFSLIVTILLAIK